MERCMMVLCGKREQLREIAQQTNLLRGLHPLEVLLAIICSGFAFGVLGLVFAVPLMIVLKALGPLWLARYRSHPWYLG